MTLNKAKIIITSIQHNLNGRMKYTYESVSSNAFRLRMQDGVSEKIRYLSFELKSTANKLIDIEFTCHGFRFNFPLKKQVSPMTFSLNNFSLLLEYGIKGDENSSNTELDLDVEF